MTASAAAGQRAEPLPALGHGIQLLGKLAGSGYRQPPALARRGDGQLVKLTPLLYELVDAIDGRRGHEELASELGARIGKHVTPDDVGFLIEHKLRPLGLLRRPDGLEPELVRSNPLLVLRPRVVITKPRLTRRLTNPFVWLFRPAAMAPLLVAFAAIAAWLLIEKGLSSSLHQALYQPWLILVVWGLVVLSAAFHEIGHAAACRYGGATPGVMGGGLYLIWPAFYTEVSDSYRLSRRGRLRVDLGGLYFTAIFAVGTAALWAATDADALLLVIAVQLLQMVRQLVPFIRADGYHIVADLIGVPDLFAHIKPTLLGLLPKRWVGAQDQKLKPWARAVVSGWVLLTVPALVAVLTLIVLTFPRIAGTAWDSMGLHWVQTTEAWNHGDFLGAVVSLLSIGLVALPALSIVYLVWYLGRRMAKRAWRLTTGRPRLRGLSVLAGAALVALVAWAWWPDGSYQPIKANESGPLPSIVAPPPPTGTAALDPVALRIPQRPARPAPAVARPALPATAPQAAATRQLVQAPLSKKIAVGLRPEPPAADVGQEAELVQPAPGPAPEAATPAPVPSPAVAQTRAAWPFPFDPPNAAKPGDNRAMVVNTTDGAKAWDFKSSLVVLEGGDPALTANEAHAYANCTGCETGAVAFQVVLIVGQTDEIAPLNAAVAANYQCRDCKTYAFADQVVITVAEPPSAAARQKLELALQKVRDLQAPSASLTGPQIYAALEAIEREVMEALAGVVAVESNSASASSQRGDDQVQDGGPAEVPQPDARPEAYAGS